MGGTVWRWLSWAILAWWLVTIAIRAFAVPWTWTSAQDLVVFCACGALIVAAMWLGLWWRRGNAGVRERLEFMKQARAAYQPSRKRTAIHFAIWIVIAGVLVVWFNIHPL
jgi:hypothetical protein